MKTLITARFDKNYTDMLETITTELQTTQCQDHRRWLRQL